MELHFSPETEARLSRMAAQRRCKPEELIEGLLWDAADNAVAVRATLDRRYDEATNGTVEMIPSEEFWRRFEEKKAKWLADQK